MSTAKLQPGLDCSIFLHAASGSSLVSSPPAVKLALAKSFTTLSKTAFIGDTRAAAASGFSADDGEHFYIQMLTVEG